MHSMSKVKVKLYDDIFSHTFHMVGYYTASNLDCPQKIEWTKDEQTDICVFTESNFDDAGNVHCDKKIAWIVESKEIHPWAYEKIKNIEDNFDLILTHDKELVKKSKKYCQVYVGSSRVERSHIGINFDKNNLVSMIASNKTMTNGHRLRHEVARNISNVDMWGSGFKHFTSKAEPLSGYMYSIAIMNARYDYYFTEILIDCFMYKVVPIFYGCPNIGDIFDIRGMYLFETIDELKYILDKISKDDYNSKLEFVNKNYEIAKNNFMITDDIIIDKIGEIYDIR